MSTLSVNEIAAAIYFVGGFGPPTGVTASIGNQDDMDSITQTVPPKNSPTRQAAEAWLDDAIAICLSESGGNTTATNGNAKGLWQIMTSVHGSPIAASISRYTAETGKPVDIFNPLVNTDVARQVYQSADSKWTPWEVYTNGSYKKNKGHGKAAYKYITSKANLEKDKAAFIKNMVDDSITVATAQAAAPILEWQGKMASIVNPILGALKMGGITVGWFLLGLVMFVLGVWFIMSRGGKRPKVKTPIGIVKDVVK